jgi:hypothetical protein
MPKRKYNGYSNNRVIYTGAPQLVEFLTDEVRWVLNHQSSLYPILISEISWVPQISQYCQKPVTKQGQEKQT